MSDIQGALEEYSRGDDGPEIATRRGVRKRQSAADIARERRHVTLAEILKVKECRELFWWLLEQYGPTRSPITFAGAAMDVNNTLTKVGMSNAGNILLAEITAAAPDAYILMLKEEQERQELRKQNAA